jgi:hypothetical protein
MAHYCNGHHLARALNANRLNRPHGMVCLASGSPEGRKIMLSYQVVTGLSHGDEIQLTTDMPTSPVQHWATRQAIQQQVAILLPAHPASRLEFERDDLCADHRHILRECRIEPLAHISSPTAPSGGKRHDLGQGMNTGVGTPTGGHDCLVSKQVSHRLLDHPLHRALLGLTLPADEAGTVVLHSETPAPRSIV